MVSAIVRRLAALALLAFAAAGCGSAAPRDFPPAAEPARSPPASQTPAGQLLRVGSMPEGIVADARTGIVAVGLRNPDRLALVDGRRLRVLRRVNIPESPRHLGLAGPGGPVLVPAERANALARVALPAGRVRAAAVGAYPHDVAVAGGRVFVGDERGATVSVLERGRVVRRIRVARQPGGLAVLDRGRVLAVVSVRERVVELFDTHTLARVGRASARG
jgi:predicted small lipoprotein YifL